jgi:cytochrome P450
MNIVLSSTSVSLSPTHYGTDAHRFLPQRWDARDNSAFLARNKGKAGMMAAGLEHKTVHKPQRGAWLGFSDGERMCIGRKFAQVVFVAVVAVVVREFEVFVEPGEEEEVRKGMERGWAMITLQARGEGKVRFRRRR